MIGQNYKKIHDVHKEDYRSLNPAVPWGPEV